MNLSALTVDAVKTETTSADVRVARGGMAMRSGVKAGPIGTYDGVAWVSPERPLVYSF